MQCKVLIYEEFYCLLIVPYSSKFPWSNIFVIFVNFAIITKIFATKLSWQQLIVQDSTLKNHEKWMNHENQARSRKFKTTEIRSHTVLRSATGGCNQNIRSVLLYVSLCIISLHCRNSVCQLTSHTSTMELSCNQNGPCRFLSEWLYV